MSPLQMLALPWALGEHQILLGCKDRSNVSSCSIGINVTNAVFTGSPPPIGYGFSEYVGYVPLILSLTLADDCKY